MKELLKPEKKKEVFESLKVQAYHENAGKYSQGGYYLDGMHQSYYSESSAVGLNDDVLI